MEKFIEKIKNQSTIVIGILLIFTYVSLKGAESFSSPQSIAGFVVLGVTIFLSVGNFFSFQISENYKFIVEELKGVIDTLKSQQKFSERRFKNMLTETSASDKQEVTKGYGVQTEAMDTRNA